MSVRIEFSPEVLEVGSKVLSLEEPLCPECRGRFFGRFGHGLTNSERLSSLEAALGRKAQSPLEGQVCGVCHGGFPNLAIWVERCLASAADFEWNTFLCGSRWDPSDLAREETLWGWVGSAWGESLKIAFNRELGKALSHRTGKEGRKEGADVLFLADVQIAAVQVEVFSVYFKGRYRKFDRTLPQTRWPCRNCKGKGCTRCGGTGKMYETSVEELVAGPLNEILGGTGHRFHGMGREDIDARMLGRGRPFVAEILSPHRRRLDLAAATSTVQARAAGRVEVDALENATALEVTRVKESQHDKTYVVVVRGEVGEAKIKEALPLLAGCELRQRTPVRVSHRRADLVRHRTVRRVTLMAQGMGTFTIEVRAQAGTYIKEFVDGDSGRTTPSLSSLLQSPLKVESLDVMEIHDEEGSTW